MNMKPFAVIFSLAIMMSASLPVFAAAGGNLMHADTNVRDTASVQRGARLFVNYCLSCHDASYMRYNRLVQDLGLEEDDVMENLVFSNAKIGDRMEIAMRPQDAEAWLGKTPPNLSLVARSRGTDWLYTYMMTFYEDETGGWNNLALPNASMPHVMWQLQGIQKPMYAKDDAGHDVIDHLVVYEPGLQSPEAYEATVNDLVTFLEYLAEPAKLKRTDIGIWVLLFLGLFTGVAYLMKSEFWRDVH